MSADPGQLVEALESEWRDALCAKDMERLSSLIHPDFVLIGNRLLRGILGGLVRGR